MNSTFRIDFGCYELALDRKSLTYSLTETVTQTAWAEGLSVGWIELTKHETGETVRHDFGDCKIVSVSEKMSGTGKRLLLGLDTPEGMPIDVYFTCAEKEIQLTVEASRDTKTHTLHRIGLLPGLCGGVDKYVLPMGEGALVSPKDVSEEPQRLPLWQPDGLSMAFFGGIKADSALALLTDSAYAAAELSQKFCNWIYERDPERRRLEIRMVLIPQGDHIAIARAYRDKLVSERTHITLRKKLREKPLLEAAIGHPWQPSSNLLCPAVTPWTSDNWWEVIERGEQWLTEEGGTHIVCPSENSDWLAPLSDAWHLLLSKDSCPLSSVVYRDYVIPLIAAQAFSWQSRFLFALLRLGLLDNAANPIPEASTHEALLAELHGLTFAAFLSTHRFLTEDLQVQAAIYTDKTRVVVNFSESEGYACEEFELPPLGFMVFHAKLTAHDALRVGEEWFASRELRIVRTEVE